VIFISIGANLPHPEHGSPRDTCDAALAAMNACGLEVLRRSRWYESDPMPPSNQPLFVNGVAEVATQMTPADLLEQLHGVETAFGRVRRHANEARVLDLDLLAYHDTVSAPGVSPVLPHPRLVERAFVILPLAELAPEWRHPVTGTTAADLARRLPAARTARPIEAAART
jgi:2-amino-4-hydroxy-6-hydroxymethyldihydropteridine diphosphokinase